MRWRTRLWGRILAHAFASWGCLLLATCCRVPSRARAIAATSFHDLAMPISRYRSDDRMVEEIQPGKIGKVKFMVSRLGGGRQVDDASPGGMPDG